MAVSLLNKRTKAPRLWRDSVVLSSDSFLSLFLLLSDKKRRHKIVSARIVAMSASDRPKRDWPSDPRPGGRQRAHRQTCGSGVEAREHPNRLQVIRPCLRIGHSHNFAKMRPQQFDTQCVSNLLFGGKGPFIRRAREGRDRRIGTGRKVASGI